jgi:hypothetical protein
LLRITTFAMALLSTTTAMAIEFQPYLNSRFGYQIDLPSTFKVVSVADNGDGQSLQSSDGSATLLVWGNYITQEGFQAETSWRRESYVEDGWRITYEKASAAWASFSGLKNGRILYVREIALCGGAIGNFALEYPQAEQKSFGPLVQALVKSLEAPKHCS